jgi:hypothetical protein
MRIYLSLETADGCVRVTNHPVGDGSAPSMEIPVGVFIAHEDAESDEMMKQCGIRCARIPVEVLKLFGYPEARADGLNNRA